MTPHQQKYKILFAFLGLCASFPVAEKPRKVMKYLNLHTGTSFGILCLNFGYSQSKRYKFVDYLKTQNFFMWRWSQKCHMLLPSLMATTAAKSKCDLDLGIGDHFR
jgi:hypothetical protein